MMIRGKFILLILPIIAVAYEQTCTLSELSKVRQKVDCGKLIVSTINTICGPNNIGKRSNVNFLTKKNAFTLLKSKRKQSVTCECCVNNCSPREWLTYCDDPDKAPFNFGK